MTYLVYIYNLILYQPLLNGLVLLYETVAFRDLGIAIILLTLLIRLLLYPLFHKSARHQAILQEIQPKLRELQEKHKDDYEARNRASLELFRLHGVNPFAGIGFLVIQIPILLALYHIFLNVLQPGLESQLYAFVAPPGELNPLFLGLINLAEMNIVMVGLAAIAQYIQGKLSLPAAVAGKTPTTSEKVSRQMVFLAPAITLIILWRLPAAASIYWLTTTIFSVFQQYQIKKQLHGNVGQTTNRVNPKNGL